MLQLMLEGGALDLIVCSEEVVGVVCVECMVKVVSMEVAVVTVVSMVDVKLVTEDSSSSDCDPR